MYLYTTKTKMTEENTENLNQNVVQNGNPYDLVDNTNQNDQSGNSRNSDAQESGKFFKKIIKAIAKMAWLPDPETWEPAKANTPTNTAETKDTTLEQDVVAQEEQKKQEEEKKKFSFENVMSGVTWVLDKIEKKVEDKTWLDFDAPLKKREERLKNEQEAQNQAQPEKTEVTIENENKEEDPIEKNNEEYLSENH